MAISEKDRELMMRVAEYYRATQTETDPEGSIRMTANHFGINRNKVRKILVTTGDLVLPWTSTAIELREQGLSIKEIAITLGVSTATVSISLPYEDKINYSLDPSAHAADVREYRAYERKLAELDHAKKQEPPYKYTVPPDNSGDDHRTEAKEWEKEIQMSYSESYYRPHRRSWEDIQDDFNRLYPDEGTDSLFMKEAQDLLDNIRERRASDAEEMKNLESLSVLSEEQKRRLDELHREFGLYTGALSDREHIVLERIAGKKLPPEPYEVMRLHLELVDPYESEETKEILKTLGGLRFGENISRDVIVPEDMPLYALHYVIQRAFGWRNSHLHQFTVYEETDKALIHDNASMWSCLVGVIYRSPLMNEDDQFWADDYTGGSEKNWLRKKYTGPYLSQCHGEGILSCQEDMMSLDMKNEYYLVYVKTYDQKAQQYTDREYLSNIMPVYDRYGNRRPEPTPFLEDDSVRIVTCPFESIPAEGLRLLFEQYPFALLERLPISSVLVPGKYRLSDDPSEQEYTESGMAKNGDDIYSQTYRYVIKIIREQVDSPEVQVVPPPFTNELLYEYDFGDSWQMRITASWNCEDLVESGRISQSELDRANVKCRETYRPVLIARDGEMLMDDVGGLNGFAEFLDEINPDLVNMNPEERDKAKQIRKERLDWAKGMGWKKGDAENFNLL